MPFRADGFEPSAYAIPPPGPEPYDHATFWLAMLAGVRCSVQQPSANRGRGRPDPLTEECNP